MRTRAGCPLAMTKRRVIGLLGTALVVAWTAGGASADTNASLAVCLSTKTPSLLAQPVAFDVGGTPVTVQYDPDSGLNCGSAVPASAGAQVTATATVPGGAVLLQVLPIDGPFQAPAIDWSGGASVQLTPAAGANYVQFSFEPSGPPGGSLSVGPASSADTGSAQRVSGVVTPSGAPLDAGTFTETATIIA